MTHRATPPVTADSRLPADHSDPVPTRHPSRHRRGIRARLDARTRPITTLVATLAALALATLPPQPTTAQNPIELEGLVVTANRWAEPAWTVAAHATVIEGVELRRAGIEYVADALRRVPGMAVVRGGSFGAVTSIFLRGGESDYVQVLIDGVPANEPGGAFDFGSLSTDNIERIEIIRGPASALYGSDAVSGVIQIFTRRGSGSTTGSLSFQAGSFATRRFQGTLSGGTEALSYSFSLGRNDTDGILEYNNEHRRTTFTGRVQGRLGPRGDATLSVRYDDRRFNFPTDGSGALADRNAYTYGDALTLHLDAGRRWSDAFETRFTFDVNESDRGSDDAPDGPADTLGFFGYTNLNDIRRTGGGARDLAAHQRNRIRRRVRTGTAIHPRLQPVLFPVRTKLLELRERSPQSRRVLPAVVAARWVGAQWGHSDGEQRTIRHRGHLEGRCRVAVRFRADAPARRSGNGHQGAHLLRDLRQRFHQGQPGSGTGAVHKLRGGIRTGAG